MTKRHTKFASQSRASFWFYTCFRAAVVGFTRAVTWVRVEGGEHVPASGACIVAPVHRSNIDTPLAAAVTRRRIRFMGKDSLWTTRWFGWVLSSLGAFPVSRGTADFQAMKRCLEVLDGGEPLVLFPEGERKSGPLVQPLFDGAAYLALKSGVPIVPVGIGGSERVMPKGAKMIRPHKVVVVVGEPIEAPPSDGRRVQRADVDELTERLRDRLQALFDQAQVAAGV